MQVHPHHLFTIGIFKWTSFSSREHSRYLRDSVNCKRSFNIVFNFGHHKGSPYPSEWLSSYSTLANSTFFHLQGTIRTETGFNPSYFIFPYAPWEYILMIKTTLNSEEIRYIHISVIIYNSTCPSKHSVWG